MQPRWKRLMLIFTMAVVPFTLAACPNDDEPETEEVEDPFDVTETPTAETGGDDFGGDDDGDDGDDDDDGGGGDGDNDD
jgi:hypothetical protein